MKEREKYNQKNHFSSFFKESRWFDLHRRWFLKLHRKSDPWPESPDPRGRRPYRVHVRGFHEESATYTGNGRRWAKIKLMVQISFFQLKIFLISYFSYFCYCISSIFNLCWLFENVFKSVKKFVVFTKTSVHKRFNWGICFRKLNTTTVKVVYRY